MKTIGIIGGMSWESSAEYYRQINETVKHRLGPTHSAELIMYSLDFYPVARLELEERWEELAALLIGASRRLESAGAELLLMASNTAHKVADAVQAAIRIPLLHIADVVAQEIASSGISAVGLLGTRFVMEQEFYSARFRAQGIDVVLPNKASRNYVDNVIYNELCAGKLIGDSRDTLRAIIIDLQHSGAEAVVLACTELPLLINANEVSVRLFDTMALHAHRAVTEAIADF